MKLLRTSHLLVGLLFLAVFVASGQYMDLALEHLRGMADGPRLLYRSAHIYLLFVALLNLLLGCYLQVHGAPRARTLQLLGSTIMLVSPVLMTLSFILESQDDGLIRPLARAAIYGSLVGVGMHFFSGLMERRNTE